MHGKSIELTQAHGAILKACRFGQEPLCRLTGRTAPLPVSLLRRLTAQPRLPPHSLRSNGPAFARSAAAVPA